jgi:hypothetical protein
MLTDEEVDQVTDGKDMSDEARARVRATLAAPVWPTTAADGDEASA